MGKRGALCIFTKKSKLLMRLLLTILFLPFSAVAQWHPTFVENRFLRLEQLKTSDSAIRAYQSLPLFFLRLK